MVEKVKKETTKITIRNWTAKDISSIVKLHEAVYGHIYSKAELYNARKYRLQLKKFPDGQFLAEVGGKVVGYATSLIVQLNDEEDLYRYPELSGNGSFSPHTPAGDTLYGADIAVHPDYRGRAIAGELYKGRRKTLEKYNLRRMIAYGRIPGYPEHMDKLTPEEYVQQVIDEKLKDPALNAHLKAGYKVKKVVFDLMHDNESMDYCTYLEYENPNFKANRRVIAATPLRRPVRRIRVCAAQYLMRPIKSWKDLETNVEFFTETADIYDCHFLVLPEYFTAQVFSTMLSDMDPIKAMNEIADLKDRYIGMFKRLAKKHQLYIVGGSTAIRRDDGNLYNVSHFFTPGGKVYTQDKLHITPSERELWNIRPGNGLKVFETPLGRVAIQICYDIEFPELSRLLALAGAEVIFVPFSTDEKKAYYRIRYSAQARCVENYIYTVISGNAGNLPNRQYLLNYSQSAILTPSDFAFPTHAVAAEADPNVETVVVGELALSNLAKQREIGSVKPLYDRRTDIFELKSNIPIEIIHVD